MFKVAVTIDDLQEGCITDGTPNVSFALASDVPGESLAWAEVRCGAWSMRTTDQINNPIGASLAPWSTYEVEVEAHGTSGQVAHGRASFATGRRDRSWQGIWVCDPSIEFEAKASPAPVVFRRAFKVRDVPVECAWVEATALGVYELELDGSKVGDEYFAPGFTAYEHQIQYQTYQLSGLRAGAHELVAHVAGGWAVGSFTYGRKSKISADRQALLAELHIRYVDGSETVVCTDRSWQVSHEGPYRAAELYDGEEYDATINLSALAWRAAEPCEPRGHPQIIAAYGAPVRAFEPLRPVSCTKAPSGEWVYDFGQNIAGVVRAHVRGKLGQRVVFRHAEVLVAGELFVKSLRTAKATATYICRDGEQTYQPHLTYMGFRYVGVRGVDPADVELQAVPLHSDFGEIGSFSCSNDDINRLNENIRWGGRSNFLEVPTDCPQRDERQGWTGDAAVFARTACFNFNMNRFYGKWLRDMRAEQGRGGGIPMVVPRQGDSWPVMANSCWGDSCIMVPWATYLSRGDVRVLRECYPMMRKFLRAVDWWSGLFSVTPTGRAIWRWPFHFGDWCAPGEDIRAWMGKGKWVATAYHAHSLGIAAQVADILGHADDAARYRARREQVCAAYLKRFTDGNGKLINEFQTAYVLPLSFDMAAGAEAAALASNLDRLVAEAGDKLSTGFTGTPYLLFALSDYGHVERAYKLLLQTECPSWLYEVRAGGTTIWERWDALSADGSVNMGQLTDNEEDAGMVSFNHYANGAVGDWLYRRLAGLEPVEAGYRRFVVRPVPGGGITWARAATDSPYGRVAVAWKREGRDFTLDVEVPVSCCAVALLPDGTERELTSGVHRLKCTLAEKGICGA